MTTLLEPPPVSTGASRVLWLSGLLAGLGPLAAEWADRLAGPTAAAAAQRTCIDSGASVVLRAGAGRELHAQVRAGDRWCGARVRPGRDAGTWDRTLHGPADPRAFPRANQAAAAVGRLDELRAWHARLGPLGHIYSAIVPVEACDAAVGWQLAPHVRPAEALAAVGLEREWRAASTVIDDVLGFAASDGRGPWSVACTFTAGDVELRIGTTRWARTVDDDGKLRRAAAAVAAMGGDGAFAEGLWRVLDAERAAGSARPLGRAVEVLVDGTGACALDIYLAGSWPPRGSRTAAPTQGATV